MLYSYGRGAYIHSKYGAIADSSAFILDNLKVNVLLFVQEACAKIKIIKGD